MSTPEQIGPYRLIEALGEGGMGAVFRAEHVETGEVVALKTVRLPKQTLLNNLRREIHTMSRLHHPGIVRIVDQGVEDAQPWYAMELVEGVTLRHYVLGAPSLGARLTVQPQHTRDAPLRGPAALLSSAIDQLLGEDLPIGPAPAALPVEDAFLPTAAEDGQLDTGRWWTHALATSGRLDALSAPLVQPELLTSSTESAETKAPPDTKLAPLSLQGKRALLSGPPSPASPASDTDAQDAFTAAPADKAEEQTDAQAVIPLPAPQAAIPLPAPPQADIQDAFTGAVTSQADARASKSLTPNAMVARAAQAATHGSSADALDAFSPVADALRESENPEPKSGDSSEHSGEKETIALEALGALEAVEVLALAPPLSAAKGAAPDDGLPHELPDQDTPPKQAASQGAIDVVATDEIDAPDVVATDEIDAPFSGAGAFALALIDDEQASPQDQEPPKKPIVASESTSGEEEAAQEGEAVFVGVLPDDDSDDESAPGFDDDAQTMLEMSPFAALAAFEASVEKAKPTLDATGTLQESGGEGSSLSSLRDGAAPNLTSKLVKLPQRKPNAPTQADIPEFDTMMEASPFTSITPMQLKGVLLLVLRLCEPLAYLHSEGIVHCDLKPDNVLIREDGAPVLIDFGLLSTFAGSINREVVDLTLAGLGTIPYMAPEQINGQLVDARTDVYALGCILYELLVGEPPFTGDWTAMLGHHLFTAPTPPSERRGGIPEALDQLVLQMLAKEPRERTGHVDVVRAALARLAHQDGPGGEAAHEAPAPRIYLFRPELVGREAELALLKEHIELTEQGGHGLVMLSGESGVGKTRLTLDLAQYARARGIQVLAGVCREQEGAPLEVFQPFFQAVKDRIRELGASAQAQLLGEHGRWLFPYAQVLGEGEREEESDAQALPPSQLRMQVFRALGQTLREFAQGSSLLLLLDDLHRADSLTLEALTHLARMRDLERVLIVGTFRSEEARVGLHLLCSHEAVTRLELARLNATDVGAMIRDMLAQPEISEGFISYLAHQSEGNPFFIAEYLRAALEEGLLWRDDQGHWQISPMYEEAAAEGDFSLLLLPSSLQLLVERRLQGIPKKASGVLALAAVFGREIPFHLLKLSLELDSATLWGLIETLRRREVLEYRFDGTLYFVHDKIREIVYDGLSQIEQEVLHKQAALAYEGAYRKERVKHAASIGLHWAHAGKLAKAQQYYRRGAAQAVARGANDEAIRLFRAYLALDTPSEQERIDILLALGQLLEAQHVYEDAREIFVEAQALAHTLLFSRLEAKSRFHLGQIDWNMGLPQTARQHYEAALVLQRECNDLEAAGWTLCQLAQMTSAEGEPAKSVKMLNSEIAVLRGRGEGHRDLVGAMVGHLAEAYRNQGSYKLAEATFQEALASHRASENQAMEARLLLQYLTLKRWKGEPAHTLEAGLQRAEALLEASSGKDTDFVRLALIFCERGHVTLLRNQSAKPHIVQVEQVIQQAGISRAPGTIVGDALAKVERAQGAFERQEPLRFGQHPDDLPPLPRHEDSGET